MHALLTSFLRTALVGLALLGLAACSLFSPHDPRHDPSPLTEYEPAVSSRVVWDVPIGSGFGYGFAPFSDGQFVYAATPDGAVVAVDLSSGSIRWRADAGTKLSAGVGSDGQISAVAAPDGTVIAFDYQGKELWQAKASSQVDVPPAVGSGVVVVRSSDYRIQAFDARDGELLWSVQRPGPALALKTTMQMIIVEDMLISGMPNGRLIAISLPDGNVLWEGTVAVSRGATDLDRISDVVGAPQIVGPLLCGVAYQGRIVCFNVAEGGFPLWEHDFSSTSGLASDPEQLYAASPRDTVYAFDIETGEERWSQNALRNRRLSGPAVVPQALAVGDYEGYLHFLGRFDGRLLGRLQLGSRGIVSPLLATARGVIAQTRSGNLVLVELN